MPKLRTTPTQAANIGYVPSHLLDGTIQGEGVLTRREAFQAFMESMGFQAGDKLITAVIPLKQGKNDPQESQDDSDTEKNIKRQYGQYYVSVVTIDPKGRYNLILTPIRGYAKQTSTQKRFLDVRRKVGDGFAHLTQKAQEGWNIQWRFCRYTLDEIGDYQFEGTNVLAIESDVDALETQWKRISHFQEITGCSVNVVYSGSKSLHIFFRLAEFITDEAEFHRLARPLAAVLRSDRVVLNTSQLMRLPGFVRKKVNEKTKEVHWNEQALLACNPAPNTIEQVDLGTQIYWDEVYPGTSYSDDRWNFAQIIQTGLGKKPVPEYFAECGITNQWDAYRVSDEVVAEHYASKKSGGQRAGRKVEVINSEKGTVAYEEGKDYPIDTPPGFYQKVLLPKLHAMDVREQFELGGYAHEFKLKDGVLYGFNPFSASNSSGESFQVVLETGEWIDRANGFGKNGAEHFLQALWCDHLVKGEAVKGEAFTEFMIRLADALQVEIPDNVLSNRRMKGIDKTLPPIYKMREGRDHAAFLEYLRVLLTDDAESRLTIKQAAGQTEVVTEHFKAGRELPQYAKGLTLPKFVYDTDEDRAACWVELLKKGWTVVATDHTGAGKTHAASLLFTEFAKQGGESSLAFLDPGHSNPKVFGLIHYADLKGRCASLDVTPAKGDQFFDTVKTSMERKPSPDSQVVSSYDVNKLGWKDLLEVDKETGKAKLKTIHFSDPENLTPWKVRKTIATAKEALQNKDVLPFVGDMNKGNCAFAAAHLKFRAANLSSRTEEDKRSQICQGCPFRDICHTPDSRFIDGAGYLYQSVEALGSACIRMHPDVAGVFADTLKDRYLIWEEALDTIKFTEDYEISRSDFSEQFDTLERRNPSLFGLVKGLKQGLIDLLEVEAPKKPYGLRDEEVMEVLSPLVQGITISDAYLIKDALIPQIALHDEKVAKIAKMLAGMQQEIDQIHERLNEELVYNPDRVRYLREAIKRLEEYEVPSPDAAEIKEFWMGSQPIPKQWLGDFLSLLIGSKQGAVRVLDGKIFLTVAKKDHIDAFHRAQGNLLLDATGNLPMLATTLQVEKNRLVQCEWIRPETPNYKRIQIKGLGACSARRNENTDAKICAVLDVLREKHPDLDGLDHKRKKELTKLSGHHGRDNRGTNAYENLKAFVCVGAMFPNIGAMEAQFLTLQRMNPGKEIPSFEEFYQMWVDANLIQTDGRPRQYRRLEEEIVAYYLTDADLPFEAQVVEAGSITPLAQNKRSVAGKTYFRAIVNLMVEGKTITQDSIAEMSGGKTRSAVKKFFAGQGGWKLWLPVFSGGIASFGGKAYSVFSDATPEQKSFLLEWLPFLIDCLLGDESMQEVTSQVAQNDLSVAF